jgi:uncharacterized protein DUF3237
MRLEHLCDFEGAFTSVGALVRPFGTEEGGGYSEGEGRFSGARLSGSARWSNFPRRRSDGAMQPNMRGVITTPDGASVLFTFRGLTVWTGGPNDGAGNQLFHVTFMADDERYRWLNNAVCVMEGKLDPTIAPGRGSLGASHIYMLVNDLLA